MIRALIFNLFHYLFTLKDSDSTAIQQDAERYSAVSPALLKKRNLFRKIRFFTSWGTFICYVLPHVLVFALIETDFGEIILAGLLIISGLCLVSAILMHCLMLSTKKKLEKTIMDQTTDAFRIKSEALWTYLAECGENKIGLSIAKIEEIVGEKMTNAVFEEILQTTKNGYKVGRINTAIGYVEFVKTDC